MYNDVLDRDGSCFSSATMFDAQFMTNVDSGFATSSILYFLTEFGMWHAA